MRLSFNFRTSGLERAKEETLGRYKEILFRSMIKMQEIAILKCPVDTGRLRSSIRLIPENLGATEYILSDGVDYGIHVEYGTSPHMPPADALVGWSRRVLGDESAAYAVAQKIRVRGTPAQPFFRPAYDEVKAVWLPQIHASVMAQTQ